MENQERKSSSTMLASVFKPVGKPRGFWMTILLMVITFGIYGIIFYYCTFEELRNYRGQGWSGVLYLLFMFLFFPLLAVPWLIPAYVGRLYSEDEQPKPISGWSGFWVLLPLIGIFIWLYLWLKHLNAFWLSKGAQA